MGIDYETFTPPVIPKNVRSYYFTFKSEQTALKDHYVEIQAGRDLDALEIMCANFGLQWETYGTRHFPEMKRYALIHASGRVEYD